MSQDKEYTKILIIDESTSRLVVDWALERNLINGATADAQFIKMVSEVGELFKGIRLGDQSQVIDGIGDALIVATIISTQALGPGGFDRVLGGLNARRKNADSWAEGVHLWESTGLLADCIAKKEPDVEFIAKMGDFIQGIAFIGHIRGISLDSAYAEAYNEIKDRKGVMFNGVFVKESDPRYAEIVAGLSHTE